MSPNLRVLFLCFSGGIFLSGSAFKAAPPQFKAPVDQESLSELLDIGWKVSIQGYLDAQQQVGFLEQTRMPDHRLDYATLLIQMKQRKYRDADESLKTLLKADPNYLPLWRARIWFSVLTEKHETALAEAQQMGRLVAQGTLQVDGDRGAGLVAATDEQVLGLLDWVGQLVGFIEGPADTAIRPIAFRQYRTTLVQGWSDAQRKAFNQGRESVSKSYAAHQQKTKKLEKETEREVRDRLAELDKKQQLARDELKERRTDLNEQKNEFRDDLREQQQQYQKDDRPLTDSLWRLGAQENMAWRSRSYLFSELQWLERRLAIEVDPIVRQQLMSEIVRLNSQLNWSDTDLVSLQNQSWSVQRARGALYRQHQQNQQMVNRLIKSSQDSLQTVDRNERRLEVTTNRERRKAKSKSGIVRVAEGKSTSLGSYLVFPFELEKVRLLSSF